MKDHESECWDGETTDEGGILCPPGTESILLVAKECGAISICEKPFVLTRRPRWKRLLGWPALFVKLYCRGRKPGEGRFAAAYFAFCCANISIRKPPKTKDE